LILLALGAVTWAQTRHWRNSLSLWTHCVAVTDNNAIAQYNLGCSLQDAGQKDAAAEHYRAALAINPDHLGANVNLGGILGEGGQMRAATNYFARAVRVAPGDATAQRHLGIALMELGDAAGAAAHCGESVRLDPNDCVAFMNLGRAWSALGKSDEAVRCYSQALWLNPNYAQAHYVLGLEWLNEGKFAAAAASFGEVLRLDPARSDARSELERAARARDAGEAIAQWRKALELNPDSAESLNNLAWVLATCPEGELRNGTEAVELAERACERTSYGQTIFVGTLAAAYAEAGQFEKAVTASERACKLAASLGQTNVLERNQQLLEQFKKRQPYRERN
jgi:tetratricopeptide (TPR) repeat protein